MLLIAGFYLVPQLKGAGLTLGVVTGAPYFVGVLAVGTRGSVNVALGGMRGITYVQAFQFWLKVFAIARAGLPAADPSRRPAGTRRAVRRPPAERRPAGLVVPLGAPQPVTFPASTPYAITPLRGGAAHAFRAAAGAQVTLPAGVLRLPAGAAVPVATGTQALPAASGRRLSAGSGQRRRSSSTRC